MPLQLGKIGLIGVGVAVALAVAGLYWSPPGVLPHLSGQRSPPSFADAMAFEAGEFKPVLNPRQFSFPEDHGPHRDQRIEWWYFTGNVATENGERFGFQITFFRVGIVADLIDPRRSPWQAQDLFIGHAALTDINAGQYYQAERSQRATLGLAGAESAPLRIWLNDWFVKSEDGVNFTAHVQTPEFSLNIKLRPTKAPVLQGEEGLSRKGERPGEASYYYSLTRLATSGVVELGERKLKVEGNAWLDREWSSAPLAADASGWDWFGLQFKTGQELMLYRIRRGDGTANRFTAGTWVDAAGRVTSLGEQDIKMQPIGRASTRYPTRWLIEIPKLKIQLESNAAIENQEFRGFVSYWEGAVNVVGRRDGLTLNGVGYMELTGY